jgi:hypothetical protein
MIRRVVGLLGVLITELVEKFLEGPLILGRNLHPDKHASKVSSVVPVMK